MAGVEIRNIDKIYPGNVHVVFKNNITIEDKEFVVLVGPSGCGKSTTLRMIAGLEDITMGELYIDGKMVNDVPPKDRDIAMVFQNYALYPHMTVYDNMAFGLKIRKFPKSEIDARVNEAAGILHIDSLLERKPKALSGGQRQRVAMGRAIVRKPKVFLFDEPLSNLDAKLRVTMRAEISRLHSKLQTTMIYVTHDQIEAMTMADKIVVMYNGHIQQIASPMELYNNPANKFVAGFIGTPPMNFVDVEVKEEGSEVVISHPNIKVKPTKEQQDALKPYVGKKVIFGVRPEDCISTPTEESKFTATVDVVEPLGADINLFVSCDDGSQLITRLSPDHKFNVGETINLGVVTEKCHYFDVETTTSETGKVENKCII